MWNCVFAMAKWWDDFEKCISNGNHNKIMHLLKKVSIPKTYDRNGNNLLHYISEARINSPSISAYLIAAGCNVNTRNHTGETPLFKAIICKNTIVAEQLLKAGADHTYVHSNGGFLHIATIHRCYNIVPILLKVGADVKVKDAVGRRPLLVAVIKYARKPQQKLFKIIKMLIDAGSDVNAMSFEGVSPFYYALVSNMNEVVELIMNSGANAQVTGKFNPPLMLATVFHRNVPLMRRLIAAEADLNGRVGRYQMTCLGWVLDSYNVESIRLLLDNDASPNVSHVFGLMPLEACVKRYKTFSMPLFRCKVQVLMGIPYRDSEYFIIYCGEDADILKCTKLLLEYGANVNYFDKGGRSVIDLALNHNHSVVVHLLLNSGAIVNYKNDSIRAVTNGNHEWKETLYQLIKYTAKLDAQNLGDGPSNGDLMKLNTQQQKVYARCKDELEVMKTMRIDGSITCFKILADRNIESYVRNIHVIKAFMTQLMDKSFSIYGDDLNERFMAELKRQRLVDLAKEGLSRLLGWDCDSFRELYYNILSHLRKSDLQNLIFV